MALSSVTNVKLKRQINERFISVICHFCVSGGFEGLVCTSNKGGVKRFHTHGNLLQFVTTGEELA